MIKNVFKTFLYLLYNSNNIRLENMFKKLWLKLNKNFEL